MSYEEMYEELEEKLESIQRVLFVIAESQKIHGILKCQIKTESRHIGNGRFRTSFGTDTYLYVYDGANEIRILLKELRFEQYIDSDDTVFEIDGDYIKFTLRTQKCCAYCYTVNYKNGSYIYEKNMMSRRIFI